MTRSSCRRRMHEMRGGMVGATSCGNDIWGAADQLLLRLALCKPTRISAPPLPMLRRHHSRCALYMARKARIGLQALYVLCLCIGTHV